MLSFKIIFKLNYLYSVLCSDISFYFSLSISELQFHLNVCVKLCNIYVIGIILYPQRLARICIVISHIIPGASPGFGRGGAKNFFFRFGNLHVAMRENFLIWCNLVRFGVYFDEILSLKNYHFLYKNFINCKFLYERINILDTRNIILVKKILKNL